MYSLENWKTTPGNKLISNSFIDDIEFKNSPLSFKYFWNILLMHFYINKWEYQKLKNLHV